MPKEELFKTRINPLDFEVIHCGIRTITEQMTAVMERTARSPEHFAGRDYSMGIFDGKGNTVCLYEGNPIHLWGVPYACRATIDFFGDDLHPGDAIWANDPYTGSCGSHLQDANMLSPVFYNDKLIFWAANRAHQVDIGGAAAGGYNPSATEIYAEGVRYPPLKVGENYEIRKDTFNLVMANMRFAYKQRGDLLAMIGANRMGERGLVKFIERYGLDTIETFLEDLYDYTERLLRIEIEKLPDGTYYGEAKGEGGPRCPTYTVRTKITIKGSDMIVDFSESDPQVPVYINSPLCNTVTCTWIALMTSIGKKMKYRSEGITRPVKVITKPGTIVDPTAPAPVSTCTNFCAKQIIECIWSIFAKIVPEITPAGWGTIPFEVLAGVDPRHNNAPYGSVDFLTCGGGTGAIWGTDGWATGTPQITSGALHYPDVEVYEEVLPNRWDVWEMEPDSGGPGRWRGGLCMRTEITNVGGDGWVHTGGQGFRIDTLPVPCIGGGKPPKPAKRWIVEPDGKVTDANDLLSYPWRYGAHMTVFPQGGCGVGDPFERDIEAVKKDVIEEKVSIEAAKREYGVVIEPNTFEVNKSETERLRSPSRK
jgi:N-methylhydantoinase B